MRLTLAVVVALTLAVGGCTAVRNPATGETQYTSLSPEDEVRLGRSEHPKVLAEYGGAYADPALQAYVSRVGQELARRSELPDLRFTFTVIDSPIVNAFALPGGYVYVSRGLLALADDEAELAGVLAHEIGHVTARHTAQRVTQAQYGQLGAMAAQLGGAILGGWLGGDAGSRLGGQLGGQLGTLGATAWVQGYSREQEFEADQLGIRYMARAGYDPEGMSSLLDALRANDALSEKLRGGPAADVPSWLASHPRTVDRIERAAAEAEVNVGGATTVDRDAYLRAIDGMVYGDSPAQGFVRGRVFEHPELRLRFTAPEGFRLANTPKAVIGQDGSGRIFVFDAARAPRGRDAAAYLERDWVGQRVQGLRRLDLPAGQGAIGFGAVRFRDRPAEAAFGVVPGDGDTMYRFVMLDQRRLDRADVAAFEGMLRSVERLSAAAAAALRPLRIEIVTVGPGDSVESLAARMEVDRLPRETFVTLNDLDRRPLRAGERVKIVRRG
jgi:predicted Zn-dependent protease